MTDIQLAETFCTHHGYELEYDECETVYIRTRNDYWRIPKVFSYRESCAYALYHFSTVGKTTWHKQLPKKSTIDTLLSYIQHHDKKLFRTGTTTYLT